MPVARSTAHPWSKRIRRTVALTAALWFGVTFPRAHVPSTLAGGPESPLTPPPSMQRNETNAGSGFLTARAAAPATAVAPAPAAALATAVPPAPVATAGAGALATAVPTAPAAALATAAPTAPAAALATAAPTAPAAALATAVPTTPAAVKPASGSAVGPQDNSVVVNQATNQVAVNVATTTVDSSNSATSRAPIANNHPVTQANTQLAQNAAIVQITGNDDSVTIVQTILQVASNIAAAFFDQSGNSSAEGQLSQAGTNTAANGALIIVTGDNQQSTINQTIFQASSNTGTIPQPIAGSGQTGQTTQTNSNLAKNTAIVIVNGNHDTVTIVQMIIQVAQNIGTTLVPHDGQTSATGTTTQSNSQLGVNLAGVSVSGNGNSVAISQGITQTASNQSTQLAVNPGVAAPDLASSIQPLPSAIQTAALSPTRVFTTLTTRISPGDSVLAGTIVRDTATVTGSAPTGTISFLFFNNGACAGAGTPAGTIPVTIVSSTTAIAASNSETPMAPGSYSFIASYGGDTSNAPSTGSCEPLTVR